MCARLEKKLSKAIDVPDESPPRYRYPNNQVHNANWEPGRSSRNENAVDRTSIVGNRERMLKRMELPVYDGCDAYGWLALAERFLRIGGYDDRAKLDVVSVSLAGDVLSWFNSESHRRGFRSWMDFKQKLIARFSKEKFRDPSQPLFAVKQTGTAAQYIHAFEDLSTLVTGLTDTQLEGIFMNGLKPEMREVVTMCKQVDLDEMISITYQMEDSVLYKVVCRERQAERKDNSKTTSIKSFSPGKSSSGWTFKPTQAKPTETGG